MGERSNEVKYIAALLMLIDHFGMLFFPTQFIWRILGRLSMPLFAYGIATGYKHTSNLKAYMWRMGIFAFISEIPFLWMIKSAYVYGFGLNIGFTFLGALFVLYLLEQMNTVTGIEKIGLLLSIGLIGYMSERFHADYGIYGILTVVVFYEYAIRRQSAASAFSGFAILTLMESILFQNSLQVFAMGAIFLIEPLQKLKWRASRYFFYLFYPVHMLVLCSIKLMY